MMPSYEDQALKTIVPAKPYSGLDRAINRLLGHYRRRASRFTDWEKEADVIHRQSLEMVNLTDADIQARLVKVRGIFQRQGKNTAHYLSEAFALITEAAHRTLGMRPYKVQVLGALIIYHGGLAEMETGEGKSLTATMPAIVTAWSRKPCHIITTNDYLAARDAQEMAPLYTFCKTTSGWIGSEMQAAQRRTNYSRGIVYTTSKELLADFLRDRLLVGQCHQADRRRIRKRVSPQVRTTERMVMRGIDTAIVDEADSVLIDEAVTPLIISRPQRNEALASACISAVTIAEQLEAGHDYAVDHSYREIILRTAGRAKIAEICHDLPPLWHSSSRREELIQTAIAAREFYHRDKQYVVEDGKIVIVDEFTGRAMPERSWRQGIHQMIEAREKLTVTNPSETLARLSFQRFFRFFRTLGGMTGTAREAANELWQVYALPVFKVPTNRPGLRKELEGRVLSTQQEKWLAICAEVAQCQGAGQPVLIGTRSIASSMQLAAMLDEAGIAYQLLNAVNHRQEADIIASAGQRGKVTIATNMAGRGADIKLGRGVAELGGLHVIISERHESARIDRQLYGRCGRQGDPGSWRSYSSLEDEILNRHSPGVINQFVARGKLANPTQLHCAEKAIRFAQFIAQRKAFRQRQMVMRKDDWLTDALSFARTGTDSTL